MLISAIFPVRRNLSTLSLVQISAVYNTNFCWFSGLGLGSILTKLRNSDSELVQIQVEVFDEKFHRDQAELENDPTNLSPQQLFDIISNKVTKISLSCNQNYKYILKQIKSKSHVGNVVI
jgi:hypothetical protein